MTDFDPYYKWLAIPPNEQPPNHYRLLGVPLFTADADVIDNAADQRMSHLRSFQAGRYSAESQRLLNEVSQARACLLQPQRRSEYDATLQKKLQPTVQPGPQQPLPQPAYRPVTPQVVATVQPPHVPLQQQPLPSRTPIPVQPATTTPVTVQASPPAAPKFAVNSSSKRRSANSGVDATKHIAASLIGMLLGYFIVCWMLPSYDVLGLFHARAEDPSALRPNPPATDPMPAVKPKPNLPAVVNPPVQPVVPKPPVRNSDPPQPVPVRPAETPVKTEPMPVPAPTVPTVSTEEQKQQRIVSLQAERTAAVAKGDVSGALLLTDELAKLTEADALTERARVIEDLRVGERTPAEVTLLAAQLIDLASAAAKAERHEFASEQAKGALLLARKSGDQELVRKATKLVLDVQEQKPNP